MIARLLSATSTVMRLCLVLLLLLVTFIFSLIQGGFLLWFVFFTLVPFAIFSLVVFFTPINNISVEREMESGRLEEGDTLRMKVTLKRKSFIPVLFLVIQEVEPQGVFEHVDNRLIRKLIPVGFKKQVSWSYVIDSLPRGRHELTAIQVGIADVLGWVRKTKYIEAPKTFIVYPKIEGMYFERTVSHEQGQFGYTSQRKQQHSTLVSSVREYAPGDRMTWLHWPSFAKTGTLYTKEFEFQQSEDVCVVFDSSQGNDYEGAVSFAASLMSAALRQKEHVSFLGAGEKRQAVEEFQTEADLEKVMYYLATIEATKFDIRRRYERDEMITGANALVLITSNLTAEWIDLLAKSASKGSAPIIYVIRLAHYKMFEEDYALERHAETRGIQIRYAERGQFASVSKGRQV